MKLKKMSLNFLYLWIDHIYKVEVPISGPGNCIGCHCVK